MRVAECHDPLVVHQKKVQNRQVKVRVPGASAHVVQTRAGCSQEILKLLDIRRKPGKCPKGEQLRRFVLIFHRSFHPMNGFGPEYDDWPDFGKDFLTFWSAH